MKRYVTTVIIIICGLLVVGGTQSFAADKNINEKIVDILRANDQLTQEQYEDLLEQAREEEKAKSAKKGETPLRMYWKKGLRFEDEAGDFKFKFGGRIMNDWAWYSEDGDVKNTIGEFTDGTEFRRARLYIAGTVYDRIGFKAQYDFAGGDADFKDVYLDLLKVPYIGHVRVGHFKEPYGLEELTSSKYITFMERSIANVAPGRNTGLGIGDTFLEDKRATWALGFFRDADGFGDSSDEDDYNLTGRVTGLPWYEEKGTKLLHVGLSYSHQFRNESDTRYRQRPESHLADNRLIDTGTFQADSIDLITPEIALVVGPFSLQSEYTKIDVDRPSGDSDVDFDSFYVEGSYFLTGEHRKYKTSAGSFSRVSPKKNFGGDDGGYGALQVKLRYSTADYDDGDIAGGELDDITVGINWHLNPNVRVMAEYINADRDKVGEVDIAQMRFQIDF